ncbi:MAG: hypothetical protein K0U66_03165 [Gammaproteobacteria bacterium]|nr:hypothetical protein [Gammaproteobacteria bacterium]
MLDDDAVEILRQNSTQRTQGRFLSDLLRIYASTDPNVGITERTYAAVLRIESVIANQK